MSAAHHQVELRVLLGPQAGSRLVLSPGEYVIGTSDACAVILSGAHVEPIHAAIVIGEDSVVVEARDGTLRDASGVDLAGPTAIELGEVIRVGAVWIAVDERDAPWPETEALGANSTPPVDGAASAVRVGSRTPPDDTGPWVAATSGATVTRAVAVFLAVCFVAGLFYCVRVLLSDEPSPAVPRVLATKGPSLEQRLKDIVKRVDKQGHLTVARSKSGGWKVSGVLPTTAERRAATDALGDVDPLPELDVTSDEELLAQATSTLATNAPGREAWIRVVSLGDGALQLVGAAREASYVDVARSAISGIRGARRVDSGVLLPQALPKELVDRIAAAGLTACLKFTVEPMGAQVTGTPTEEQISTWQTVAEAFHVDFGDVLPLHVAFTRPALQLPFGIKTIVGGAAPFVLTTTHQHLAPGGAVDGYTLTSIDATSVVFDGKQRLTVSR